MKKPTDCLSNQPRGHAQLLPLPALQKPPQDGEAIAHVQRMRIKAEKLKKAGPVKDIGEA
jgi:hypothetical protein